MSLARLYKQLFQRVGCVLRENAYYIHTQYPFPSVLITLNSKKDLINPLIKQFTRKDNFILGDELQKFKISKEKTQNLHAQTSQITSTSIYGLKFNEQTEFLVAKPDSQTLFLQKEIKPQDELYGVILFKSVSDKKIKHIFTSRQQITLSALKLFVMILFIKTKSRYQNHHLIKQKK